MRAAPRSALALLACLTSPLPAQEPAAPAPTVDAAKATASRATAYLRTTLAHRGGYLWWYSTDLQQRAGETKATPTQVWVQWPGTPTVGLVFLRFYDLTGDRSYLDGAVAAGECLAWGQLASGGWDYRIDFDDQQAKAWHFRRQVDAGDRETGARRNVSVLDDDNTQSALRFLMALDQHLTPRHETIHHALMYGLDHLLGAQYPNGAWPQRFSEPADPSTPVIRAHYPKDWPRTWPNVAYKHYYTLNDGVLRDCINTLFLAHQQYGDQRYRDAALKAGDFLILAQMPEPQPTWAQQYNLMMEPAWARKFEPPAACGGESVGALRLLVELWLATGDRKYLEPLPRALRWFRESRLPNGNWARFYELRTNRPLFFVKDTYELTYSDRNVPTHYSFQANYAGAAIDWCEAMLARSRDDILAERQRPKTREEWEAVAKECEPYVATIVRKLDAEGRWVEKNTVQVKTYVRSMTRLADWLEAQARLAAGG